MPATDILTRIKRLIPAPWKQLAGNSSALWRVRNHVAGQAFYCRALAGESNYNICINCDLTVSCNCRDYDGSGIIGDLAGQSLQALFDGPRATAFREALAAGGFAIPACADCWERVRVPRAEAVRRVAEYATPTLGIMVENTARCNLRCVACNRERLLNTRRRTAMSLDDMRYVADTIRACAIRQVAFHNLGEPFASASIREELTILRDANPDLRIICSTNGVLLNSDDKRQAALLIDHLTFSMDGPSQEVLTRYQRGGNFEAAYQNMHNLAALRARLGAKRPLIEWKYVLFDWNDDPDLARQAIDLARTAGVDHISFWPGGNVPGHLSARYHADPFYQDLAPDTPCGRVVELRTPPEFERRHG